MELRRNNSNLIETKMYTTVYCLININDDVVIIKQSTVSAKLIM